MAQPEVPIDETDRLIASNKVEGTAVFGRQGEKLGTIHNFMVDKRSGQVEYAVLTFGGAFGLGGYYYPLPWRMLTYDTERAGYVVDLDRAMIERAPRFSDTDEHLLDQAYSKQVYNYYGLHFPN